MEEMGANQAGGDSLSASKEVKLQLPLRTHVSLHSLKLIKNQSIRDSVVLALDRFFQRNPVEALSFAPHDV